MCCARMRRVTDVGGGAHVDQDNADYDQRRTAWLEKNGYSIVRVANPDIVETLEGVLPIRLRAPDNWTLSRGPDNRVDA